MAVGVLLDKGQGEGLIEAAKDQGGGGVVAPQDGVEAVGEADTLLGQESQSGDKGAQVSGGGLIGLPGIQARQIGAQQVGKLRLWIAFERFARAVFGNLALVEDEDVVGFLLESKVGGALGVDLGDVDGDGDAGVRELEDRRLALASNGPGGVAGLGGAGAEEGGAHVVHDGEIAHGQRRIVRQHRADPHQNGVMASA